MKNKEFNTSSSLGNRLKTKIAGFTLIEILVAITILASLTGGVFVVLNPARQLNKARDAASLQGLQEIRNALDLYNQDHNCFPDTQSVFITALQTGGPWVEANTTYIAEAPLDGYGNPYIYMTDPSISCPQWYVVFARLSQPQEQDICPLDEQSDCVPEGFDDRWACVTGGITGCALLSGAQVNGNMISYPTPTPPSGTVTPTPTEEQNFIIAMQYTDRPQFFTGTISTINPDQGEEMTLEISTDDWDGNPAPVTSLTVTVESDNTTQQYTMFLASGTATNGTWETTWIQSDTANHTLLLTLDAQDSIGNTSDVTIAVK